MIEPTRSPLRWGLPVTVMAAVAASGVIAVTPTEAASAAAVRTYTGAQGAAAGSTISQQACDFDGDGVDDIVTGAWMWDRAPFGRIGAAYVVPGGTPSGELDDPRSGIIRIEGPQRSSALVGFSVSCAGDVDADGFDDIIIGDYTANGAWVVFGSDERQNLSLEFLGDRGHFIEMPGENVRTGYHVSGVGDVDGDGHADLGVVSLNARDRAGEATVVRGRDDIATVDLSDDSEVIMRIVGEPGRGVSALAPAGDVDGDGIADLAVGGYVAAPASSGARAAGMAWAVSGGSRGLVELGGDFAGFAVEGPARGQDRLGMSVAAAGDVDGDGFDDLLIGADASGRPGGAVVVRGSDAGTTVTTDPEADGATVTADGEDRGWWIVDSSAGSTGASGLGYAVSAVEPAEGRTGTLVLGAFAASRAVAVDTSALTSPRIDLAEVDDELIAVLTGSGDRLGRGIGVIEGFDGEAGGHLVAGGDAPGERGTVQVAALPPTRPLAEPTPEPTADPTGEPTSTPEPTGEPTPGPTGTPEPTSTPEPTVDPTGTPEPTVDPTDDPTGTPEPSPEPTADEPTATPEPTTEPRPEDPSPSSPPDDPADDPTAPGTDPADPGDDPSLPRTGGTALATSALGLIIIGLGAVLIHFTRRNRS